MASIKIENINTIEQADAAADAIVEEILTDIPDDSTEGSGTFSTEFWPNKVGGSEPNGRYTLVYTDEDGNRSEYRARTFNTADAAREYAPLAFPDVILPEGVRIRDELENALAAFLVSVKAKVRAQKRKTRAWVFVKRDGVTFKEALSFVEEEDAKAAANESTDGPADAPAPVADETPAADNSDDVFDEK